MPTRPPRVVEVVIDRLGAGGDGIAATPDGQVFVPFALPGETWRVRLGAGTRHGWRAEPLARLAGGARAEPPCPHFGRCGGCRLQHVPAEAYARFKRRIVVEALARQDLHEVEVADVALGPPAARRRLRLGLTGSARQPRLGLRRRLGHEVLPIERCAIALPQLDRLIAALPGRLAGRLAEPLPYELSLSATDTGVDLRLDAGRPPTLTEREAAAELAHDLDLARIAWCETGGEAEPLIVRRPPSVAFGPLHVAVPPGAFLQATAFGEARIVEAVLAAAGDAHRALDLYAGLGTLSGALLARGLAVHAVEGDPGLAAALRAAGRAAARSDLAVETRDLDRRPLAPPELAPFDLVVLDPPRAGAAAQVAALAASAVPRIAYVSCNPASFARDARHLVEHGYHLEHVQPIDQFTYSAEVELVARLMKRRAPLAMPPRRSHKQKAGVLRCGVPSGGGETRGSAVRP